MGRPAGGSSALQSREAPRHPDFLAQAGEAESKRSPELGRESESHWGGLCSGRSHLSSDIPDHVGEDPRGGGTLKSEVHQRQRSDERRAAWPSFPRGVHGPEVRGQRPEPCGWWPDHRYSAPTLQLVTGTPALALGQHGGLYLGWDSQVRQAAGPSARAHLEPGGGRAPWGPAG